MNSIIEQVAYSDGTSYSIGMLIHVPVVLVVSSGVVVVEVVTVVPLDVVSGVVIVTVVP